VAVLRRQEGPRRSGITEVAACKHLGEHATDAELALEPLDGLERKRCYFQARGGLG
jgi:hypothetical protein